MEKERGRRRVERSERNGYDTAQDLCVCVCNQSADPLQFRCARKHAALCLHSSSRFSPPSLERSWCAVSKISKPVCGEQRACAAKHSSTRIACIRQGRAASTHAKGIEKSAVCTSEKLHRGNHSRSRCSSGRTSTTQPPPIKRERQRSFSQSPVPFRQTR